MKKSELMSKIDERIKGSKDRIARMSSVRELEIQVLKEDVAMFLEIKVIMRNTYGLTIYYDKEAKVYVIHDKDKELMTQGKTEQEAIASWIDGAILLIKTYRDMK